MCTPKNLRCPIAYWVISPMARALYHDSHSLSTIPTSRNQQSEFEVYPLQPHLSKPGLQQSLENLLKTKPVTSQSIHAVRKYLPTMSFQHFFSNRQYNHYSKMETRYLNCGYTRQWWDGAASLLRTPGEISQRGTLKANFSSLVIWRGTLFVLLSYVGRQPSKTYAGSNWRFLSTCNFTRIYPKKGK